MDYPIELEGFEGQAIMVRLPGLIKSAELWVDGHPAPPGQRRGQYQLTRDDGTPAAVAFKFSLIDSVPRLAIDGKTVDPIGPMPWYELLWSGLVMLVAFAGGLDGMLAGLVAFWFNARIFRSDIQGAWRYIITGLISLAVGLAILILSQKISLPSLLS